MFTVGKFSEVHADGAKAVFGTDASEGAVLVPFTVSQAFDDDAGNVRFEPAQAPDGVTAPFASAAEIDWLKSVQPRHPRGAPCTNAARIEARQAWLDKQPPVDLPPRGPVSETCVAERFIEGRARVALEACALTSVVLEKTHLRLGARSDEWSDAEIADLIVRIEEDPAGCLYEHDIIGAALDQKANEAAQAIADKVAAEQERKADDGTPNERTCHELGVLAIRVPKAAHSFTRGPLGMGAAYSTDEHDYYLVASAPVAGLAIALDFAGEVLPSSYVPACAKKATKNVRRMSPNDLLGGRKIEATPVTEFFSLDSADGRYRAELGEELMRSLAPKAWAEAVSLSRSMGLEGGGLMLAFEVLLRGLRLRPDVAKQLLVDALDPYWRQEQFRAEVITEEKTIYHDEDGRETVPDVYLGLGPLPGGTKFSTDGRRLTPEVIPAVYSKKPKVPPCCQDAEFNRLARYAIAKGRVSPDECYSPPDAETLDRIQTTFGRDPWEDAISSKLADSPAYVRTDDLVSAIGDKVTSPEDYKRLRRIMKRNGYMKKTVTIKGEQFKAFARVEEGAS